MLKSMARAARGAARSTSVAAALAAANASETDEIEDDEAAASAAAEGDDETEGDEEDEAPAASAESDDEDEAAASAAAEGDDETEGDEEDESGTEAAVDAESIRVLAIVGSKQGMANPALAVQLATPDEDGSRMSAKKAKSILAATPGPAKTSSFSARMQGHTETPGADGGGNVSGDAAAKSAVSTAAKLFGKNKARKA